MQTPSHSTPAPPQIQKIEFEALGTHWWIEIWNDPPQSSVQCIVNEVARFERTYSRFKPDSQFSILNRQKRLVQPTTELLAMLAFAKEMHETSNGIFNISVGGTLARTGYGRGQSAHTDNHLWEKIIIRDDEIVLPNECEIDFGGFGKGWLIDRVGALLRNEGHTHYVINGGGDILVSAPNPIELALEHPLDPSQMIGNTRLVRGALAVSSSVKRAWVQGGIHYHHIIDPRTDSSSSSDILTTYVRADSALIADTMATILLIEPSLNQPLSTKYNLQTILLNRTQLV